MDKKQVIQKIIESLQHELTQEADTIRRQELEAQLLMFRFLPVRNYSDEDVIVPSALVTLETSQRLAHYFLVPSGGGWITEHEGKPLQVLTPQSPLGEAMNGKRVGDTFQMEMRQGVREYKVIGIF